MGWEVRAPCLPGLFGLQIPGRGQVQHGRNAGGIQPADGWAGSMGQERPSPVSRGGQPLGGIPQGGTPLVRIQSAQGWSGFQGRNAYGQGFQRGSQPLLARMLRTQHITAPLVLLGLLHLLALLRQPDCLCSHRGLQQTTCRKVAVSAILRETCSVFSDILFVIQPLRRLIGGIWRSTVWKPK